MPRKRTSEERKPFSVSPVEVEALSFLTVGPETFDLLLDDPNYEVPPSGVPSFVRIRPPVDATETRIATIRDRFVAMGARVRVLPVTKPQTVLERRIAHEPEQGLREVVLQLVEESNTQDRDALRELVEDVLAGVSL